MFTLRPYQEEALTAINQAFVHHMRRPIISLATGLGKTVIFATQAQRTSDRVLVLAHRDELIDQASKTLRAQLPADRTIGRVVADCNETDASVIVASVQTLYAKRLRKTWPPGHFALVIIDEAHHAASPSYKAILDYLQPSRVLGVTATPYRGDKVTLSTVFDGLVYHFGIREGIRDHWLTDLKAYRVETKVDLDPVHTQGGDFQTGELAQALDTPERNRLLAEATQQYAPQRRTICFTITVDHAHHMAAAFNAQGMPAAALSAETPKPLRQDTLRQFHDGTIQVICNCGILTEGFDEPRVEAIVLARPTKSLPLFTQMVGRGTRPADDIGKTDCIIIDAADNTKRHRIATINALIGLETTVDPGASIKMVMDMEEKKIPQSLPFLTALSLHMTDVPDLIADWVESAPLPDYDWRALADELEEIRALPADMQPWQHATPLAPAPQLPITEGQRYTLLSYGWDADDLPKTQGEASWAIERHLQIFAAWGSQRVQAWAPLAQEDPEKIRAQMFSAPWHFKLATDKQVKLLRRLKVPLPPYPITAGEASWIIDRLFSLQRV